MKLFYRLVPLVGILLAVIVFAVACRSSRHSELSSLVSSELNQLKDLDAETALRYLSDADLFGDTIEQTEPSEELSELFRLFFDDFNYKIRKIHRSGKTASADVRLTTLDASALARDYVAAALKERILSAASEEDSEAITSLEDKSRLLIDLLKENDYDLVTREITIPLAKNEGGWRIQRSVALEDDLVGGLITALSNPEILSPEETVDVYLSCMKEMDSDHLAHFLGIESLIHSEDTDRQSIAEALTRQLMTYFDYTIEKSESVGYESSVELSVITFDSEAILRAYQEAMDAYLASADAVIDGYDRRVAVSKELLLSAINDNEASVTVPMTLHLWNDGSSWKLTDPGKELGTALFGSLTEEESTLYYEE